MTPRDLVVLLDCGDTLIDESTQIFDDDGVVLSAELVPGADRMLEDLRAAGFRIALVADGRYVSFRNLLTQHGLYDHFESFTCSDAVRHEKPSARMFKAAIGALDLDPEDAGRCVMVGNNLSRDIAGANALGIGSIHLDWTPRYPTTPESPLETPDHTIHTPSELLALLETLDAACREARR